MKKAYILLLHKNPAQASKLVNRLNDQHSSFFIHVDKKVPLNRFEEMFGHNPAVRLVERVNTSWGSIDLVQATLNALKLVSESGTFEKIILLSGQDYPVQSNAAIDRFYRNAAAEIFIEHFPIPNYEKWSPNGGMFRLEKYFLGLKGHQLFFSRALNLLSNYIPLLKRQNPTQLKPFAGSQWWTLNSDALKYILKFVDANPQYLRYHRYTFAPDEVFFQTILLNATDPAITGKIENNNLVYAVWQDVSSSHPKILGEEDVATVVQSGCLFARKFEQERSSEVFDSIDRARMYTEVDPVVAT